MLRKTLKTKDYKCLAIRCLTQCFEVALQRLGDKKHGPERTQLDELLENSVKDITTAIKKGPSPDLHVNTS